MGASGRKWHENGQSERNEKVTKGAAKICRRSFARGVEFLTERPCSFGYTSGILMQQCPVRSDEMRPLAPLKAICFVPANFDDASQ